MNTKTSLQGAAAAVTGARHLRAARNGQDAAAYWVSYDARCGAVVVCDGCGSGASSEVGARLGARLAMRGIEAWWASNGTAEALWTQVRTTILASLSRLVESMVGEREQVVHDHFLFTLIAAVAVEDTVHVLAIGDGAYAIDGVVRELGPFANNMPPYLAYELLGAGVESRMESAPMRASVVVATDGVAELGLVSYADEARALVRNPDALRRRLAVQAKGAETIEWSARRVVRTPAVLQDDGAVALLTRGVT